MGLPDALRLSNSGLMEMVCLDQAETLVGNAELTLTTLHTVTVPANSMVSDGDSLEFEYRGLFASGSANVEMLVAFGAAAVALSVTSIDPSTGSWVVRGRVVRTGAAAQRCYGDMYWRGTGAAAFITNDSGEGAEDFATPLELKIQAIADLAADVTLNMARVTLACIRP